jgi:hypothetical protein
MAHLRFGTAIACIDGRIQEPVRLWLKDHYHLDAVDMVTEPGVDKVFTFGPQEIVEQIKAKALISLSTHGSSIVALVSHAECANNLVSEDTHREYVRTGMQAICNWSLPLEVIGLWVNDKWEVEEIHV